MSTTIGTLDWSARTNGILRPQERIALAGQVMLGRLASSRGRAGRPLGRLEATRAGLDPASIKAPDTSAARAAQEQLRLLCAPWLVNHSMRTHAWAALLGKARDIACDDELLFVASALHAVGLADQHPCGAYCSGCFAVEGAREADALTTALGWPAERRECMAEAIALHLNVRVPATLGAEAHLLHAGAMLDLTGQGAWELGPDVVQAVLVRHPHLDFRQRMQDSLRAQASASPGSRTALLVRAGLLDRLEQAWWRRWDEQDGAATTDHFDRTGLNASADPVAR
jgi:hypothetical protein